MNNKQAMIALIAIAIVGFMFFSQLETNQQSHPEFNVRTQGDYTDYSAELRANGRVCIVVHYSNLDGWMDNPASYTLSGPESYSGTFQVNTYLKKATVWIGDYSYWNEGHPAGVAPGTYTLTTNFESSCSGLDWKPWSTTITVPVPGYYQYEPQISFDSSAYLPSNEITIRTIPLNAKVRLRCKTPDGQTRYDTTQTASAGSTTFIHANDGSCWNSLSLKYIVDVSASGYYSKQTSFTLTNYGLSKSVSVSLDMIPPKYEFTFFTVPSGCKVSVAGKTSVVSDASGRAVFQLEKDTYEATVSKSGYITKKFPFTVTGIGSMTTTLNLAYPLKVYTNPSDCLVEVIGEDSKKSGTTYAYFPDLEGQSYKVVVSKPGYISQSGWINTLTTSEATFNLAEEAYDVTVNTVPNALVEVVNYGYDQTSSTGVATFKLKYGTYNFKVSASGWETTTVQKLIEGHTSFTIDLLKLHALTVITEPGAKVVTASKTVYADSSGKAIIDGLYDKTYSVVVSKDNYQSVTRWVEIKGDDKTEPIPIYPNEYDLIIECEPKDAQAYIPNVGTKTATNGIILFQDLPSGIHKVTISKTGYLTKYETVDLDRAKKLTVSLTIGHTLTVITTPGDSKVILQVAQTSPTSTMTGTGTLETTSEGRAVFSELSSGSYRITVTKQDYVTQTRNIYVGANKLEVFTLEKADADYVPPPEPEPEPEPTPEEPTEPIPEQPSQEFPMFIVFAIIGAVALFSLWYVFKKVKK